MSGRRKKKRRKHNGSAEVELNIMPFIDVFSILNTFLLMSSVSLVLGIIEVQIPFLSSDPPDETPQPRSLSIKVDMEKDKVFVISEWSKPPGNTETKKQFSVSPAGSTAMHKYLVSLRQQDPKADRVQFFTEDDVVWNDMAMILDSIKLREPGDPDFPVEAKNAEEEAMLRSFLFPKVVLSSVMLR